jgi:signal transduction histidine kinase
LDEGRHSAAATGVATPAVALIWFARRIAITVVLALAAVVALHLRAGYDTSIHDAETQASSIAVAIDQHLGESVRSIDALLTEVAEDVAAGRHRAPGFADRMQARLFAYPAVRYVGIVDPQGRLQPNTWPDIGIAAPGLDVNDRTYLRRQRNAAGPPHLVVGDPVVGRASGERTIHVSRPVPTSGGGFAGIVIAAINPDVYARFLNAVLIDQGGAASLLGTDGRILAVAPLHEQKFGSDVGSSDLFAVWMPHATVGVAHLVAATDGIEKLLAYRQIQGYPLIVTAGIARSSALLEWRRLALIEVALALAFAIAVYFAASQLDKGAHDTLAQRAHLESLVEERTAAFVAARDTATRRAERLGAINQELQRLAVVTAHHLQEPVRPMISYAQLVTRHLGGHDAELDSYLGFIRAGGIRLKALLRDFESYVDVLTEIPQVEEIEAGVLATAAAKEVLSGDNRGAAVFDIAALPTIRVDPAMLREVFLQFFGNAIAHRRREGPVRVRVTAKEVDGEWQFSVTDDGPGIPPLVARHVFQVFANAHGRDSDSTGIGLPLCRVVVEAHGGHIWIEQPQPGEPSGTIIRFALPKDPIIDHSLAVPSPAVGAKDLS